MINLLITLSLISSLLVGAIHLSGDIDETYASYHNVICWDEEGDVDQVYEIVIPDGADVNAYAEEFCNTLGGE